MGCKTRSSWSRALGRELVERYALDAAASGATVVACSRTSDDLESLSKEIEGKNGTCHWLVLDVASNNGARSLVDFAVAECGQIDALVNNAGTNLLKDTLDYTAEEVENIFSVNLTAVYWLCVCAARQMIEQRSGGAIVNITSQAGVVGGPGRSPYSEREGGRQ